MNRPIEFVNPKIAFEHAFRDNKLSRDTASPKYAGNYMYMYSERKYVPISCGGQIGHHNALVHIFKSITTRQYNVEVLA